MGAKNKKSRAQKINNRAHKALKNFKNQIFGQNVKDLGLSLTFLKSEKNKVQINSEEDVISDLMELIALNSIKWTQLEHRIFSVFIYSILGKKVIFNSKIMLNFYFLKLINSKIQCVTNKL